MDPDITIIEFLRQSLLIIVLCMGAALLGAIALLITAARQIRDIDIPEDADFFETLQHVPITVPLALDLLDMAFDVFSAPISWVVLEMLGLQALQLITVLEGFIPGTQVIPTLTIAWGLSRIMGKRRTPARQALYDYQLEQRRQQAYRLGRGRGRADAYRQRSLPGPQDDIVEGEYYEEDWGEEPPPGYYNEQDYWE
ncbi:MAG TPA: hypothetical protein PK801_11095 [Aggregatilineales bacterium]|nr:hypothetical protein [Chloroflexota bacterium]HOA25122.1 hypothetical protein [Aggregatilineales bacterium]HPV08187.1 hypothetical protein [Aggregatilineales bacterium]HQA68862.1 hypothetical protein [Aggregatilineales bacterium]HQE19568.1 hypothetical protein [Aggregatilineales bacterium]